MRMSVSQNASSMRGNLAAAAQQNVITGRQLPNGNRRSARRSRSDQPHDANPKPDGIFGKDTARFKKRDISAIILANVKQFCYQINTNEVFGTHYNPCASL